MNLYMQFEPLKFYLNQNIESRQSDYCLFESAFGNGFFTNEISQNGSNAACN